MARSAAARSAPARSAKPRTAKPRTTGGRAAPSRSRTGRAATTHKGTQRPATRRHPRQGAPRRKPAASGRARSAPRAGAAALPLPLRVLRAPIARAVRARGRSVLNRLLSGQGWIGLVGVLLAGIVFFNVYLLQLNRDIAATSERAAAVKRENARLRLDVARLGSSERIQLAAAEQGLVLPAPGEVRYLKSNPSLDGRRAARRVAAPDSLVAPAPVAPEVAPEPVAPEPTAPVAITPPVAETPVAPVPEEQAASTPAPIATSP